MTRTQRQRAAALTRKMLIDHVVFASLIWGGFVIVVGGVIAAIAVFSTITVSVWEQAASQVPRWYVLFIGGYLGYSTLPLHIAHGQTRRTFAGQAAAFMVVFAAVGAVLMVVGFGLEAILYHFAGWPQTLSMHHLFSSPGQVHLVFAEFLLRFLAWGMTGGLLGSAFYRAEWLAIPALLSAIVPVALVEIALAPTWAPFEFIARLLDIGTTGVSLPTGLAFCAAGLLLLAATTWLVIRDIPLRNKTA